MEIVNKQVKNLNRYATKIPQLVEVSNKAGVEPGMILGGAIVFLSLMMLLFGGNLLTVIVTVVYPAIRSM